MIGLSSTMKVFTGFDVAPPSTAAPAAAIMGRRTRPAL
jgi:hypothetical protein